MPNAQIIEFLKRPGIVTGQVQQQPSEFPLVFGAEFDDVAVGGLFVVGQEWCGPVTESLATVTPISNHPGFESYTPDDGVQASAGEQTEGDYEYARSMRALRLLGQTALDGSTSYESVRNQARQELESSIAEMLKSDDEHGDKLEITRSDRYKVRDGQAISFDGVTPVVNLVENGVRASKKLAGKDSKMKTQNRRDEADLRNATKVDEMLSDNTKPNTIMVASLEPIEAMERDGEKVWKDLNYVKGLAYLQVYHRTDDGELETWTLSVDMSDKDAWRQLWAEYGAMIPGDETTDNWVDYTLEFDVDDESLEATARGVRDRYSKLAPDVVQRDSVDGLIAKNSAVVDQVFDQLYSSLGESLVSGQSSSEIRDFASGVMNTESLKPDIKQRLLKIANGGRLAQQDILVLEELVRYSLAEELRSRLERPVVDTGYVVADPDPNTAPSMGFAQPNQQITPQELNQQQQSVAFYMGDKVKGGVAAGRSYGSCGSSTDLSNDRDPIKPEISNGIPENPQEVFGGRTGHENLPDDKYGSRVFDCPKKGCKNVRPKDELIEKCQKCGADVTC